MKNSHLDGVHYTDSLWQLPPSIDSSIIPLIAGYGIDLNLASKTSYKT